MVIESTETKAGEFNGMTTQTRISEIIFSRILD